MPSCWSAPRRCYPAGRNPNKKAWRYPGVRIPFRLQSTYENKLP
jgi:hypothetical protein